jgi:hypothetical protein
MLPGPARASHLELTALPWHSLLAAAFPVLFLFAENSADQVTLRPLWVPLGVAIAGAAIGVVVGRLATGDWYRGGLMATLALALFFSFGHVWFAVEEVLIARRWLIGAYLLIALVGGWLIWRGGAWVRPASRFLSVALTALVAVNALSIANSTLSATASVPDQSSQPVTVTAEGHRRPDVYYLIMDEDQRDFQWLDADAEQIQRKFGILNALYLPGVDPASVGLNQRSSPVNALRYVLNAYFDAGLPLLPDTTYLSPDYPRIYDFVEIHRNDDGTPILPVQ